ncbi:phenylacetate-CoA oxygenase subunit PaaC [Halomonas sp. ISL-60]|uniref:1,2-phenylacetyl-CoA epoxidase subunit PaaC n=1 Tax=Halomonas sp. ISL-56 TaxID=2819149 RepID=UPI001BE62169|nr:1,2-phenylacetyl-CoA epoxidase subunit PaaC [Halomonas sp. ISL-56]MBT2774766.1 phenylacetate-CoA oxygenase subunit PaaC [Halomonas sp. ISL-60]MBT2802968.1 phenylacetate-CoA oxygenase subunit PaaC [Halomonas sp. ISL-56]
MQNMAHRNSVQKNSAQKTQAPLTDYLLRLGDSALVLGQRHAQLCGKAPALEEELALMNVGLDLFGQARNWLGYAAELMAADLMAAEPEGQVYDADSLAFRRDAQDFRNLLLVEQPNGDFADIMGRQFLFDAWHVHLLDGLSHSSDPRIAEVAAKSLKEATYHLRRSSEWVIRLGDGTEESHTRMQRALDNLWQFTGELLQGDEIDQAMLAAGIAPDLETVATRWKATVEEVLEEATLVRPSYDAWMYTGGKVGHHTEHLGFLLAEMQYLPRAYPDATVW